MNSVWRYSSDKNYFTLVKHLLAKITIVPEHLLFEFKSGVNITIEK